MKHLQKFLQVARNYEAKQMLQSKHTRHRNLETYRNFSVFQQQTTKCNNYKVLNSPHFVQVKANQNLLKFRCLTTKRVEAEVTVAYKNGFPVISIPLPSRKEYCVFTLRPILTTVGQFLEDIRSEDKGIDRVVIYTKDDVRVASSTQMDVLLQNNFKIQINDTVFAVNAPKLDHNIDSTEQAGEVRRLVTQLYTQLNVETYQLQKENRLKQRIEEINTQLKPLEQHHRDIVAKAEKHTKFMMWGGLMYMSVQFGVLARLTWWEYSWDIMEPVTYFITYGTAIIMYGYFLLTKQECIYPDARDRQFLISLHRAAESSDFNIQRYNSLLEQLAEAESDLRQIKNPLHLSDDSIAQN